MLNFLINNDARCCVIIFNNNDVLKNTAYFMISIDTESYKNKNLLLYLIFQKITILSKSVNNFCKDFISFIRNACNDEFEILSYKAFFTSAV